MDAKFQTVIDASSRVRRPPEGNEAAASFAKHLASALEHYRAALRAWNNSIEEPMMKSQAEGLRGIELRSAAVEVTSAGTALDALKRSQ